jgi:hypothetical protein
MLLATACAGLTSLNLGATVIGTFNLGGDIFVNGVSTITWTDNTGNAGKAVLSEGTGIYAALDGQEVDVATLHSNVNQTTNSSPGFTDMTYVVFPAIFNLQPLLINTIWAGVDGSADCNLSPSTTAPPQPQVCTPALPGGQLSPFNMENNPPPDNITSTTTFAFSGDANGPANTSTTWFANYTTQFNVPYQTILSELGSNFSNTVSDSYSATFTVEQTPTPETSSIAMFALGLGMILLARSTGLLARLRRQ